ADVVAERVDLEYVAARSAGADVHDQRPLTVLRRARLHRPPRQEPSRSERDQSDDRDRQGRNSVMTAFSSRRLDSHVSPRYFFSGATRSQPVISMWRAEQNSVQ